MKKRIVSLILVCFLIGCGNTVPQSESYENTDGIQTESQNETDDVSNMETEDNTQVNDWLAIELPEGYTLSEYKENVGNEGGVLIEPQVYGVLSEDGYGYVMDWTMSGSIGIISNVEDIFIFENDKIADVRSLWNHSLSEKVEILGDLDMPAILYHVNHDLYTAADIAKLQEQGINLSPEDTTSDYWYIFFTKEDGSVGYYLALDQRQFTKEDALNIAKTVKFVP